MSNIIDTYLNEQQVLNETLGPGFKNFNAKIAKTMTTKLEGFGRRKDLKGAMKMLAPIMPKNMSFKKIKEMAVKENKNFNACLAYAHKVLKNSIATKSSVVVGLAYCIALVACIKNAERPMTEVKPLLRMVVKKFNEESSDIGEEEDVPMGKESKGDFVLGLVVYLTFIMMIAIAVWFVIALAQYKPLVFLGLCFVVLYFTLRSILKGEDEDDTEIKI